jgi:hypothetical protein
MLERLSLETLSSQVLELRARPEPTQLEHLSDTSFLGKLLVFLANVRLDWKVIASYEHSSLFCLDISDKGKKVYIIDSKCQCYKTFCGRNLQMFVNKTMFVPGRPFQQPIVCW